MPSDLPRPGLVGRLIRVGLAALLTLLLVELFTDLRGLLEGAGPWDDPGFWFLGLVLLAFSGTVVQELVRRPVRAPVTMALLGAAGLALLADWATAGAAPGEVSGTFLWAWALGFSLILIPAFLLAAVLGTPGCEVGAYADLEARARGHENEFHGCAGCVDRLDGVRIAGRW